MARTRQIKPDFFADEDLALLSPMARLLFAGLWTLADRHGRLEDRPLKIKAAVFPYECVDADALLDELAAPKQHAPGAFIVRYEANGRKYLQVCNFEKHQHCHPKEPAGDIPGPAVKGNGSTVASRVKVMPSPSESVPSVPSESVPSDVGMQLSAIPPADRTERAIKATTNGLRAKLYALVDEAVQLDPKKRDPTELMQVFTGYTRKDGSSVNGMVNAALLTHERLEKSIADAEEWIAGWKNGRP